MGCALPQADGGMEVCRWIGLPIIDVANISSITLLAGSIVRQNCRLLQFFIL